MRPDDPPSPRFAALLFAALAAIALVIGGSNAVLDAGALAAHVDTPAEETAPGEARGRHRAERAEERAQRPARRRRPARRPRARTARTSRRSLEILWRSTPLRGPPRLATT